MYGTRALRIESENRRLLVICDLHLGMTAELADQGIEIPSQIPKTKERILNLIEKEKPNRLILLGDIKHNVPITSWQEWRDLPDFFSELNDHAPIEILPGNHDGDIEGLVPQDVIIHDSRGITVSDGKVGLMHGHTWPNPKLLKAETIVTGHNHPIIEFRDKLGARMTEPAWVKAKIDPEKFPEKLRKEITGTGFELLVIPAFNKLIGGAPVNRGIPEELLGPMFKAGAIQLDEAEIYLLDGTFLGELENLKKFENTQKEE
ncbi:hypothetical protein AKJ35_00535 [candidate division MSBL1 archaeon SCGC-AAA833F18]|uniref:Calcineurin-like phosphoesterase domain-containing protein n=1 Tax=candidate division MSBL1 archaeon SCGC-AAA833F18 TaxID=1698257 RepID=A0A133VT66_9EURY|nr:hypothetical protein AKJ35_00535 [candidate division MSBL1 archaeon SCGC-AAA833F18]